MSVCVPGTFLRWDCGGVMQCNETAMRRELREKRRWRRSRSVGRRADNVHGRRRASRKTLYKELRSAGPGRTDGESERARWQ